MSSSNTLRWLVVVCAVKQQPMDSFGEIRDNLIPHLYSILRKGTKFIEKRTILSVELGKNNVCQVFVTKIHRMCVLYACNENLHERPRQQKIFGDDKK